jgi:hypothetical protein
VPKSAGWLFTMRSYSFADAAELFFFVSGFIAATVYGATLRERGMIAALIRIWRRAWSVFAAQMVLFVFVAAEISLAVVLTGRAGYFEYFRLKPFIAQTDSALLHALTLHYQPAYADILPVYICLFLALPFVLAGLRRNPWAVLGASFGLYLVVQLWGWTPTTWPFNQGWFFNPLAWQFLFLLGASFATPDVRERLPSARTPGVLPLALLIAVPTVIVQFAATLHNLWFSIPLLREMPLPVGKESLEWLRIVSFFATAVIALRVAPQAAALKRHALGRAVIRCGQHSLPVFCLGVMLAIGGHVVWNEWRSMALQAGYTLAGVALSLAFAALLDWSRTAERPRALVEGARAVAAG